MLKLWREKSESKTQMIDFLKQRKRLEMFGYNLKRLKDMS